MSKASVAKANRNNISAARKVAAKTYLSWHRAQSVTIALAMRLPRASSRQRATAQPRRIAKQRRAWRRRAAARHDGVDIAAGLAAFNACARARHALRRVAWRE
jgi:hypothetical protein